MQNSFSNLSVISPTSQLILQPFRRLTYATAHSQTLFSLLLRHKLFTYVAWRADHDHNWREKEKNKTEPYPSELLSSLHILKGV